MRAADWARLEAALEPSAETPAAPDATETPPRNPLAAPRRKSGFVSRWK